MLKITNLKAKVEEKDILKGFNLTVNPGEVHAIMGINGSGKSTLANILAGREDYEVTDGSIEFEGNDVLEMSPEDRACSGIFLAFQYPVELPGVNGSYFLRTAYNSVRKFRGEAEMGVMDFQKMLTEKAKELQLDESFLKRSVNEGFSGGEKKRNEILQLSILNPKLAILDETDSGLDVDAMQVVSDGVNKFRSKDNAVIVITHYQRLLNHIVPDFVHIMIDGKIVKSGGKELALQVEENGYNWIKAAA